MKRREFLQGLAATSLSHNLSVAAGANDAGELHESSRAMAGTIPDWVLKVRSQLPASRDRRYFQTAAFGPSPESVIAKIKELLDVQLRGPAEPECLRILQEAEDSCRPLTAEALGAKPEEVALTHNTTEGLNVVLWSIDWKPG